MEVGFGGRANRACAWVDEQDPDGEATKDYSLNKNFRWRSLWEDWVWRRKFRVHCWAWGLWDFWDISKRRCQACNWIYEISTVRRNLCWLEVVSKVREMERILRDRWVGQGERWGRVEPGSKGLQHLDLGQKTRNWQRRWRSSSQRGRRLIRRVFCDEIRRKRLFQEGGSIKNVKYCWKAYTNEDF